MSENGKWRNKGYKIAGAILAFLCVLYVCIPRRGHYFLPKNLSFTKRIIGNRATSNQDQLTYFKEMLHDWPPGKPKAVIYYLTYRGNTWKLKKSLELLDRNFNIKFMYPVVIFYEGVMSDDAKYDILSHSVSPLFFQKVTFDKPEFIKESLAEATQKTSCPYPPDRSRFPGYNQMCRFHTRLVLENPILTNVSWYWRLDDDSEILDEINYDVFQIMERGGYMYGYNYINQEDPLCVKNFKGNVSNYLHGNSIKPKQYHHWPSYDIFWNNFEIANVNFWRRPDVWKFIKYIDRQGGIYYDRWGDAPIKTAAVTIFLDKNQTYFFSEMQYRHGAMNTTWKTSALNQVFLVFTLPVFLGMTILLTLGIFLFQQCRAPMQSVISDIQHLRAQILQNQRET